MLNFFIFFYTYEHLKFSCSAELSRKKHFLTTGPDRPVRQNSANKVVGQFREGAERFETTLS